MQDDVEQVSTKMMMVIPLLLDLQPTMAFPVLLVTRQRGGLAPQREEMGRHPAGGGAKGRRRHGRRGEGWRGWRPQEVGGGGRCEGSGGVLGFVPPPLAGHTNGPMGPRLPPLGLPSCPLGPQGAPSWACWPKAQAQNWKSRRNAEISLLKFEFEHNYF